MKLSSTEIISLAGLGETQLSATDSARRERDALLAVASAIVNVDSLETANGAASALQSLKGFTRQIEDARAAVKAPVLELGKRIDGLARELTLELDSEATRIGKTLGAWQAEERRKEEEAQRKAREEEQRIWREAQEKERLERERLAKEERDRAAAAKAEADRLAKIAADAKAKADKALADAKAEEERARAAAAVAKSKKQKEEAAAALAKAEAEKAQATIASAKSEEDRLALEAQEEERKVALQIEADERQQRAAADADKRREEAGQEMVAARIAGNQIVAQKPAGVATREEVVFEVTDVVALYEAAPYLVTLEPNKAAIKSALKNLRPDQSLPGIKWWKEAKTHVR